MNFSKDIICRPIVALSKHVLPCFCISPWQLLNVIRSGMLLCGVPSRNSVPIPISTRNRNSGCCTVIIRLLRRDRSSRSISFSVRESGSRRSSSNSFPLAWSFPTSFYIFVSSSSGWPCVNSKLIAFSNSEIFCQVGCSYFLNVFY